MLRIGYCSESFFDQAKPFVPSSTQSYSLFSTFTVPYTSKLNQSQELQTSTLETF
ncbi:hypothetical protein LINGRAHAP2_LOCUS4800 [Linum grandiflorum]